MTWRVVLKYAAVFVIVQLSVLVKAGPPKDDILRRGIVMKIYPEAEINQFRDEVTIDGITYIKSGAKREKDIGSGTFLVRLQRYVQKTLPTFGFDFMLITRLTGLLRGQVVTGATLLPLKHDEDLKDAVILFDLPSGLEFVMTDKQCAFIKFDDNFVSETYYCGDGNFISYK